MREVGGVKFADYKKRGGLQARGVAQKNRQPHSATKLCRVTTNDPC